MGNFIIPEVPESFFICETFIHFAFKKNPAFFSFIIKYFIEILMIIKIWAVTWFRGLGSVIEFAKKKRFKTIFSEK